MPYKPKGADTVSPVAAQLLSLQAKSRYRAFLSVRLLEVRPFPQKANSVFKGVGRPGLEPGTNPESFRGCSVNRTARLRLRAVGSFFV